MNKHILHIGRIIEVRGSRIVGELDAKVNDLYRTYKSRKYAVGQVGSIVKIISGNKFIFGIVTSLRMVENEEIDVETHDSKWIEVELFGQGIKYGLEDTHFNFERGISTYPLPGQEIRLATSDELTQIYKKPDEPSIKVGNISQAPNLQAHLLMDELLGKHFAILGTTGSGKSCTVSLLLNTIINNYPASHIVLLDPHNEYPPAFGEKAETFNQENLIIPHWLLNFEEVTELFIGKTEWGATRQVNILKDNIVKAKKKFNPKIKAITIDTPVPYKLSDLISALESEKPTNKTDSKPYESILIKIQSLMEDKRFEFIMRPDKEVKDNLAEISSQLLRIPVNKKPISIIDLSGVPTDVTDVVVSVLCRTIFDFALWNHKRRKSPVLLVCEEAHRYIPKKDQAAFQPTKRALSSIAKEGRKYGVSLGLISQRPSELSETILSQCNTIVALRMTNDQDQQFVKNALPDTVSSMVDTLPALQSREGLVVGEGVVVPMRVFFDEIDESQKPSSSNVPFSESWAKETLKKKDVEAAIENWRTQKKA